MENTKKIRWGYLLSSLGILGIGIVLICAPGFIASVIGYVAGAALMLFGIVKVVHHFFGRVAYVDDMLVGVLLAMFGFVIIRCEMNSQIDIMRDIYAFIGILLILDGVFKVKNAFLARAAQHKDWIGVLIGALIVMGFGILVLVNPFGTVNVTIVILGVSVLLDGLQNLYSVIRYAMYAPTPSAEEEKPGLKARDEGDAVEVDGEVVEE